MEAMDFCVALLDGLEDFDRSIPPLGLYAAEDLPATDKRKARHQEWYRGLEPRLKQLGCTTSGYFRDQATRIDVPGIGSASFKIIRISKIKVRKYGSHYRLDKHENFAERWDRLRMDKELSHLWKPSSLADPCIRLRVVLFIGFDRAEVPFARELSQLEQTLQWNDHGVIYLTRSSMDLYERNFSMRLSVWAKLA